MSGLGGVVLEESCFDLLRSSKLDLVSILSSAMSFCSDSCKNVAMKVNASVMSSILRKSCLEF